MSINDKEEHPDMVRWFTLGVLLSAARRAIISGTFGAYADRRLTHALLDSENNGRPIDLSNELNETIDNGIWVDYVADLGDGFDSTYAIAYLLGKKKLKIDKHTLPRGNILIMGGDQVYPTPSREEYKRRFENPYSYAFPYTDQVTGADHPYVFLLPGNHDWYDGLTLFLAKFCRGYNKIRKNDGNENEYYHLGNSSWRLTQSRSYFSIKISKNWWIWGIDTQLDEDIDMPQHKYFEDIAIDNKDDSIKNIIICASTPSWLEVNSKDPEKRSHFNKTIDHIASDIIKKHWKNSKIFLVVSGDLHHYSRYTAQNSKAQFITSGGGGAFLHPTHQLSNEINNINWLKYQTEQLTMSSLNKQSSVNEEACFPSKTISKRLVWRNLKFPITNWHFSLYIGFLYGAIAFLLTMLRSDNNPSEIHSTDKIIWACNNILTLLSSPIFWILFVTLCAMLFLYAFPDNRNAIFTKLLFVFLHSTAHFLIICSAIVLLPILLSSLMSAFSCSVTLVDWYPRSWSLFLLIVATIPTGFIGGFVLGVYLAISSYFFNEHSNDAFSAMRIDEYKNFLRIHVTDNTLTIYPIGLTKTPSRNQWKCNENAAKGDQNQPKIIPENELNPILIEDPITISLN